MFDLDDPNVRISLSLTGYVSVRIGLGDRNGASCPHPHKLAVLSTRLRQYRTALGEAAVELEQYSARIAIAAGHHGDRDRGKVAPADQRLDPYPALQPRFQRAGPVSAALGGQRQANVDGQSLRL
jgi:hypothetical protein